MLLMAMFVLQMQWLQLQLFIAFSLVAVIYVIAYKPYETTLLNFLNIFNEIIGLVAGYLLLPLQDKSYEPEMHYEMAYFAVYTFYFSASINLLVILGVTSNSILGMLKTIHRKCCTMRVKKGELYEVKSDIKNA